jgi:hypothetical protein
MTKSAQVSVHMKKALPLIMFHRLFSTSELRHAAHQKAGGLVLVAALRSPPSVLVMAAKPESASECSRSLRLRRGHAACSCASGKMLISLKFSMPVISFYCASCALLSGLGIPSLGL